MAKATSWPYTDAETRERGEQTGLDKKGDGYTLVASNVGLTSGESNTFNILAAGYFMITGTDTMTAGGTNSLSITAYNEDGSITTGYDGSYLLEFSGLNIAPDGVTNPTVNGTNFGSNTTVVFESGVSVSGGAVLMAYCAETQNVYVEDSEISSSDHPFSLTVRAGSATNVNLNVEPASAVAGVAIAPAISVEIRDTWMNRCTGDNTSSVVISIDTNPGSGTLSGVVTKTVTSGVVTFGDLSIN